MKVNILNIKNKYFIELDTGELVDINENIVQLEEKLNSEIDLYKKRVIDLLLILGDRDRMIDKMAEQLTTPIHDKEWVIKYFEERCKNAKD